MFLVCFFFITYFIDVKNNTLEDATDAQFEHDRKVIFGLYICIFLPIKALFIWNLKVLYREAVEKDIV